MSPRLFINSDELEIVRLYVDEKWSMKKAANRYDTSVQTISNILRRRKVPLRSISEATRLVAYRVDEAAFQAPLSRAAEYWAGFLMADGCVRDEGVVVLYLQQSDDGHIRKFRRFLKAQAPIRYNHRLISASVGIQICCPRMADDLVALGVTPRKSLVCRVDESVVDSPDFWRGVIDGDGYIHPARRVISLVGGELMLQQWQNFAVLFGSRPMLNKAKGAAFTARSNAADTLTLLSILYAGAPPNARLERKHNTATQVLGRKWR